jgi:5-methylcytosine-specific restriction endonuclease McrA
MQRAYAKKVATSDGRKAHQEACKAACIKRRARPEIQKQEREAMQERRKDPMQQAKDRELTRLWRVANPGKAAWAARVRRDKVAQHTPCWANQSAIGAIYRRARELGQTVDHVVPLRGKNVSGLHVEYNLQILPRSINSSKGNHFNPNEEYYHGLC